MDHFPLIKAFLLRLMLIKGLNNTFKAKYLFLIIIQIFFIDYFINY